ncbi:MAG: type II secretion system protein N [bacterium]|nr:type II secretion system protein N [bacterium]
MTDAVGREVKAAALTPYFILGLFLLVLALLVRAPASLLQKALPASLPLTVSAWGGSVWNGQAAFSLAQDAGYLHWTLQPRRLLAGRLAADVQAQGAVDLSGTLELGRQAFRVEGLRGELPSALLRSLLPPGWELPGNVRAEALTVARDGRRAGAWTAASGQLLWAGGPMQYNMNGQPQGATLPPLVVNLRLDGDALVLTLSEKAGNLGLATVHLGAGGQVETQLRERLLHYSPGYHGSGAAPDAVVVTSRQVL